MRMVLQRVFKFNNNKLFAQETLNFIEHNEQMQALESQVIQ